MRTLNNTVIKNLTIEMGRQIIQKYKDDGWDTRDIKGSNCELNGDTYIYYGVINGYFRDYTLKTVQESVVKIIDLDYTANRKPKRGDTVLVWDEDEKDAEPRIFITEIEGARYPICCVDIAYVDKFNAGKGFDTCCWAHYKFPSEDNRLKELEEQYRKLGEEIQKLKS